MKAANKKISKFRLKLNNFPYKLGNFHFLNENAELLSVVPKKKKRIDMCQETHYLMIAIGIMPYAN
jgi:hypothetical protein